MYGAISAWCGEWLWSWPPSHLHKDRNKPDRHIFFVGTVAGGVYEYVLSVLSQIVFGQVFWDYTKIPLTWAQNQSSVLLFLGNRRRRLDQKPLSEIFRSDRKNPKVTGYVLTWCLVVFMTLNMLVSALALIRYDQRAGGPPAESGWERVIDLHFDDQRMQHPLSKLENRVKRRPALHSGITDPNRSMKKAAAWISVSSAEIRLQLFLSYASSHATLDVLFPRLAQTAWNSFSFCRSSGLRFRGT